MEDTKYEWEIFHSQERLPVVGLCCVPLSCWLRKSYGHSYTSRLVIEQNTGSHSLKTDSAVLLRVTSLQLIECRKSNLIHLWSFYPYLLIFWVWKGVLQAPERETRTTTSHKTLHIKFVMPTRCAEVLVAQFLCK